MLSVSQKSSAGETVLKSYVNGLVSPQGMVFLYIQISFQKIFCGYIQTRIKPRIMLELIKTNLKKSFEGLLIS